MSDTGPLGLLFKSIMRNLEHSCFLFTYQTYICQKCTKFSEINLKWTYWNIVSRKWFISKYSDVWLYHTEDFNPFPHIDAFRLLCSRRLFENIVRKEEIAQNKQFLLLPQCFPLLVIGYQFNDRDFLFFDKVCSKSSAAVLLYEGKG